MKFSRFKLYSYAEFSLDTGEKTFEIYISLTQWALKFKTDRVKGIRLFWVGPISLSIWDNKVHNEWMDRFLNS